MNADLAARARRVVIVQLLVSAVVAGIFFGQSVIRQGSLEQGAWEALSAFFGGLSSVMLALISIRGFKRANEFALSDPKKSMMILYVGAVVRFAAVLILLGIGLGLFKLEPLAVFIGFAVAQASYLMGVRGSKQARNPDGKL
jgi:hypothetical protein